jgi:hypothetical protein
MIALLHRLYERDARSATYGRTLALALLVMGGSVAILAALAQIPFAEVLVAGGEVVPARVELIRAEGGGTVSSSQVRVGQRYELGAPLLRVTGRDGQVRTYAAPCRCTAVRSEVAGLAAGPVAAGQLIAELVDADHLEVHVPLPPRWRGALPAGARLQVTAPAGRAVPATLARTYLRRAAAGDAALGVVAVLALPGGAELAPGATVQARLAAPAVPLWRFFLRHL